MSIAELFEGRAGPRISDPRRMSLEIHAYLRELIASGVLPPGTELKQTELARAFAVSRTPLREHSAILEAVRDGQAQHAVELMAHHLSGTALRVMEDFAPGRPAAAVLAAVELVTGANGERTA